MTSSLEQEPKHNQAFITMCSAIDKMCGVETGKELFEALIEKLPCEIKDEPPSVEEIRKILLDHSDVNLFELFNSMVGNEDVSEVVAHIADKKSSILPAENPLLPRENGLPGSDVSFSFIDGKKPQLPRAHIERFHNLMLALGIFGVSFVSEAPAMAQSPSFQPLSHFVQKTPLLSLEKETVLLEKLQQSLDNVAVLLEGYIDELKSRFGVQSGPSLDPAKQRAHELAKKIKFSHTKLAPERGALADLTGLLFKVALAFGMASTLVFFIGKIGTRRGGKFESILEGSLIAASPFFTYIKKYSENPQSLLWGNGWDVTIISAILIGSGLHVLLRAREEGKLNVLWNWGKGLGSYAALRIFMTMIDKL